MIQENIILRKVMKKMNMKEAKNEQILTNFTGQNYGDFSNSN